jgi:hypothetical protein
LSVINIVRKYCDSLKYPEKITFSKILIRRADEIRKLITQN